MRPFSTGSKDMLYKYYENDDNYKRNNNNNDNHENDGGKNPHLSKSATASISESFWVLSFQGMLEFFLYGLSSRW